MIIRPGGWAELERGQTSGVTRRRLLPASQHDLFLAVRHPSGQRMLTLQVDQAAARRMARRLEHSPTATQGIELALSDPPGPPELQLRLRAAGLADLFDVLVSDVATAAAKAVTTAQAADGMVEQHDRWVEFLRLLEAEGLGPQARRGLFGELSVLHGLLQNGLDEDLVVRSWVGPERANQDFQLPHTAIEVKTSAGREPQHLTIASERQLDPSSCGTLLLCHLLVDERHGGDGTSLDELVESVRGQLSSASTTAEFNARLIRAGLLPHQRALYDDPRYSLRKQSNWHVIDDFPRLVESDLRPGVGSCSYQISTAGLEHYLLPPEELARLEKAEAHGD